jgi:tape measure domain-containing protein
MAADVAERLYKLTVQADQALAELGKISGAANKTQSQMAKLGSQFEGMATNIKRVAGALTAAFAVIGGAKEITQASEKLATLQGSFQALLGDTQRAGDLLTRVFGVVANTGAPLDAVATSTQRLALAMKDLGSSNEEIAQVAENFIKLGRVSGASMEDVTGALVQYTQALASGKLQGDELRSILERVPAVAQVIAKELGVSTGALKELGSQGKITADVMANALLNATKSISENFEKLPRTLSQGFNTLMSNITQVLAQFDKWTGISQELLRALDAINGIIGDIRKSGEQTGGEFSLWQKFMLAVRAEVVDLSKWFQGVVALIKLAGVWTDALVKSLAAISTSNFGNLGTIFQEAQNRTKAIGSEHRYAIEKIRADETKFQETIRQTNAELNKDAGKERAPRINTIADAAAKAAKATKEMNKSLAESLTIFEQWDRDIFNAAVKTDDAGVKLAYFKKTLDELNKAGQGETTFAKTLKAQIDELAASLDPLEAFRQSAVKTQEAAQQVAPKLEILFDLLSKGPEAGGISSDVFDELYEGLVKAGPKLDDANAKTKTFFETLSDSASQAGNRFIDDFADKLVEGTGDISKSFGDMVESMLKSIAKLLLSTLFQQFIKALANIKWGGAGDTSTVSSAHGNVFANGQLVPFARGGLITRPTIFPMARGAVGLAGEAGTEAIVPLTRHTNGDLGVKASPTVINVYNSDAQNTTVETTARDNSDGSKQIDIYIKRQVKGMFDSGEMDRQMRQNYGVSRQAV